MKVNPNIDAAHHRWAFTIVELMVVVAILSLLMAILLPALSRAKETTRRAACKSNLSQMMVASINYSNNHRGWMPDSPRVGSVTPKSNNDGTRNIQFSATGPEVIGKNIAGGYLPDDQPKILYCPSRDQNIRFGMDSNSFGWAGWANGHTVEYAYQHRTTRRLSDAQANEVYGGDLAIQDNYSDGGITYYNVSVGADICHGDQYYNVSFYDQSVRAFIDREAVLESSFYYNSPGRVLNTLDQLN